MSKQWKCKHCDKTYVHRRNVQNHMVAKHGYKWWDNNEICIGPQLHNPTGPVTV